MQIQSNVSLKDFSTMRLGGPARYLAVASSKDELVQSITWAQSQQMPLFVLGGGSNVIVRDAGFEGLMILNRLAGFDVLEESEAYVTLRIGAGENWDDVVERTVNMGLTGIEAMSLIPGTAGATPVQNVGAYGQEIADTFQELEAYDLLTNGFMRITKSECGFSYRNSVFKSTDNRRYVISNITLRLKKGNPSPPFYDSLQNYFQNHDTDMTRVTPADVRRAVTAIRTEKLPDPSVYPNTGSFFKNPVVERSSYETLVKEYPDIPSYEVDSEHVKIPAGWLIDKAGMKSHTSHGMKTFEKNALVFVNISAQTFEDLQAFKTEVCSAVYDKFRIELEQEPEVL